MKRRADRPLRPGRARVGGVAVAGPDTYKRRMRRTCAGIDLRPGRWRRAGAALGLLLALAGCVEVDGELRPDGSLHLRYTYDPPRHATAKSERARLSSPHVRVERLEPNQSIPGYPPGEFVTATLAVDNATRLPTAPAFADVRVSLDRAARRIQFDLPGLDAAARARAMASPEGHDRRALRVSLLLPGPARAPAPPAAIDGRRVTWTLSIGDVAAAGDTITLAVSWDPPA